MELYNILDSNGNVVFTGTMEECREWTESLEKFHEIVDHFG